jgi:VIT1/CCC1 family predicted Fe2+/Mn2+ transporter
MRIYKDKNYLRSSIFGFEDALVSTTGVIVGVSIGTSNKQFVILAAFVTIAVEAISMAAGQFLSERTLHEIDKKGHKDNLLIGSLIMFSSYFLGGALPILPIFFFPSPVIPSTLIAFSGLFALGYVKGKLIKVSPTRSAVEMLLIGGVAAIIGMIAGYLLKF